MTGSSTRLAVVAIVMVAVLGAAALPSASPETSKVVPVQDLQFYQNKERLTVANAWGDPTSGPHSNFIKIPAGAKSGLHTHSFSYYGVVVRGTLSNEASDAAAARPLEPGSYWFQRGGEPHVTNCLSKTDCLIFVTSKGPFDFHKVMSAMRPAGQRLGH